MKKVLAIVLSLLMVLSCMTCLFTSTLTTASAAASSVSVTGTNLLADIRAADFTHHETWQTPISDATITIGEAAVSAIKVGRSSDQKFYFTKELTAGVTYTYSFSVKGAGKYHGARVFKASEISPASSVASTSGVYLVNKYTGGVDAREGHTPADAPFVFTPTETDTYVFFIAFTGAADSATADHTGYIYNLSLVPTTKVSAKVEGNGVASVVAGENNSFTFTATPYGDSSFLGWYDAEGTNLLSKEATYTYTGEIVANPVTAKFNGTNLVAGTNVAANWASQSPNIKPADYATKFVNDADSNHGGTAVKVKGIRWQANYLPLGITLELGKTYNLQFSYKSDVGLQQAAVIDGATATFNTADSGQLSNSSACLIKNIDFSAVKDENINKWVTLTATITPTATYETPYLYFYYKGNLANGSTNEALVSDLSVSEPLPKHNVTATADGNGTAVVSAATATEGTEVTFTATAFEGEQFLGWYNGDNKVSDAASYTVTVGTVDLALIAKFTKINLLGSIKAADFIHHETWQTPMTDVMVNDGEKEVSAIKVDNADSQKFGFKANLVAGSNYVFSYTVKSAKVPYWATRVFKVSDMQAAPNWTSVNGESSYLVNAFTGGQDASEGLDKSFTFTATETAEYIFFVGFNGAGSGATAEEKNAYFYNFSLKEVIPEYTVAVSAEGNGKAVASNATVQKGKEVTLTATPAEDEIFLGWYDGDALVSTSATYTTTVNADLSLVAKFTGTNLLASYNASNFKHIDVEGNGGTWASMSDVKAFVVGDTTVNAFKGSSAANQAYRFTVELKKGVTYKYSISIKSNAKLQRIRAFKLSEYTAGQKGYASTSGEYIVDKGFEADISEGITKEYTFTPDETTEYIFWVKFTGLVDNSVEDKSAYFYNLSLTEVGGDDISMANFKGNSIRATGTQALRFRFNAVNTDLFSEYAGYEVKEFGAVAIRTKYLGDAELTVDGEYTYSGKAKAPVKGTFTADDISEDGTISLALYNLGTTKYADGSIKSTNFAAYNENYTVRMYAVLVHPETSEEITLYGAEQTANVFAVMNAILRSTATDDQTVADQAAVNTILASATTDSNGKTVKALYDEAYPAN